MSDIYKRQVVKRPPQFSPFSTGPLPHATPTYFGRQKKANFWDNLSGALKTGSEVVGIVDQIIDVKADNEYRKANQLMQESYAQFVFDLQKNQDYDNHDELLTEWKDSVYTAVQPILKTNRSQKAFESSFENFYNTKAFPAITGRAAQLVIEESFRNLEMQKKMAIESGSIKNLEEFLYGRTVVGFTGATEEITQIPGMVELGHVSEDEAARYLKDTRAQAYVTQVYIQLKQKASQLSYEDAIKILENRDKTGNYARFKELTEGQRGEIGSMLLADYSDERTRQQIIKNERQEAAWGDASKKFFADPNFTQTTLRSQYKADLKNDDFVRIEQWFADRANTNADADRATQDSFLAAVAALKDVGTGPFEISAFITRELDTINSDTYRKALQINNGNENFSDVASSRDRLERGLAKTSTKLFQSALDLFTAAIREDRRNSDFTIKSKEEWKITGSKLGEFVDDLIRTHSQEFFAAAMDETVAAAVPGLHSEDYKGKDVKVAALADSLRADLYEQLVGTQERGLIGLITEGNVDEFAKVTNYVNAQYRDQFDEKKFLRALREGGLLPSGREQGHIGRWEVRKFSVLPSTQLPVVKLYNDKSETEVELTVVLDANGNDIWVPFTKKRYEEEQIKARAMGFKSDFLFDFDPREQFPERFK